MENLKMIENDLVPVYITSIGDKVVYGTELHAVLKVKTAYKDWSERRLFDIDAVENKDYQVLLKNEQNSNGGRPQKEHIIKLDTAKEMAMLERNDIGKSVRKYFIKVEERYKEQVIEKNQLSPQLQLMNMLVESINKQELEQKRQAEKIEKLEETTQKQNETIKIVKDNFNKRYYNIGLIIGALRAELESGSVAMEDAYNLLTDRVKNSLREEFILNG